MELRSMQVSSWLRSLCTHLGRKPIRRPQRRPIRHVLAVEHLEDRTVPATFVVTNVNNPGAGSLRQAILDANSSSGADTITFNIPGSGVHTIAPTSALPNITEAVTIDGYTQPGASANT